MSELDDILMSFRDRMTEIVASISILADAAVKNGWFESGDDFERQTDERAAMMHRLAAYRKRLNEEQQP